MVEHVWTVPLLFVFLLDLFAFSFRFVGGEVLTAHSFSANSSKYFEGYASYLRATYNRYNLSSLVFLRECLPVLPKSPSGPHSPLLARPGVAIDIADNISNRKVNWEQNFIMTKYPLIIKIH